jgi:hypothetical protein
LFLGNGNGTFQAALNFATDGGTRAAAVADLNADGIPDLVSANQLGNDVSVLLGSEGAAAGLHVTAPTSAVSGTAFTVTVTALTAGNLTDGLYVGTIHFKSTDGQAVLPADYTFTTADAGVHTFTVTMHATGSVTITVTDTAAGTIKGTATASVTAPGPQAAGRTPAPPAGTGGTGALPATDRDGDVIPGPAPVREIAYTGSAIAQRKSDPGQVRSRLDEGEEEYRRTEDLPFPGDLVPPTPAKKDWAFLRRRWYFRS